MSSVQRFRYADLRCGRADFLAGFFPSIGISIFF
jgi:hypothetical protein